ncbi:hypothetical protein CEJ50_08690 [Escherichia coli]|nr:hypothetical protein CEJ50_08690 [Escherichia coli]
MPRMLPDSTDHSTHRPFLQPAISVTCATQTEPGHVQRRKRKLTAVCSHQTRIGNLDAHLI